MTSEGDASRVQPAAWYAAPLEEFLASPEREVLGTLSGKSEFAVEVEQAGAWAGEISCLRAATKGLSGWIYLEFEVPRLGSRIDAVLLLGGALVPIEFKVGAREYARSDREQAWDYALDLKNFHEASHAASIFPVLLCTEATQADEDWPAPHADGVRAPLRTNTVGLGRALRRACDLAPGPTLDGDAWGRARYCPTPTIVQAARALYAGHSVTAISRSDAGARNLEVTAKRVEGVIEEARVRLEKAIVFVTGVPGAGKTLVGLDVATRRGKRSDEAHAVYLSGNGPLVAVLREALTRDELSRRRARGEAVRKGAVGQEVQAFIQNVHHFRDEALRDPLRPPVDRVVIFDEAQRAWNRAKTADFMKRRKNRHGFSQSEPEFLLSYMDRHGDWAVVICLVGGGQEIHTGEAGIGAWLTALQEGFPNWRVHLSPQLGGAEYDASETIAGLVRAGRLAPDRDLHLGVSMRSFRAETVSNFVAAALAGETDTARSCLREFSARYPVAVTRDLELARRWIRERARGSERYGLVASSQAQRLKPHAIDVRVDVDPVHWFLDDANDTRSSLFLEDAATEFQVQGLELDWVCATWDADLRRTPRGWSHHSFRGDQWIHINAPERRRYQLNAYRVLLTRARQGMVVFVPPGDARDSTRSPEFYDSTYAYLVQLGFPPVA